jgi:hypothetical protein
MYVMKHSCCSAISVDGLSPTFTVPSLFIQLCLVDDADRRWYSAPWANDSASTPLFQRY